MSSNGDGTPILQLSDIHTYYGSIHALKGISLEVHDGEIVTLLGANGAGKSTTLRSINGLNRPRQGKISFQGRDITGVAAHEIVKRGIAQSPEGRRLFPKLTVEENLWAILEHGPESKSEKQKRVDSLLDEFGLTHLRKQIAATLSGGEKRRCEISRALTTNPQILLLDEPFVGIDPITVADIQSMLQALKNRGLGILILQLRFSLNIAGVFAVLIILSALGVALHLIMQAVQKRIIFWAEPDEIINA